MPTLLAALSGPVALPGSGVRPSATGRSVRRQPVRLGAASLAGLLLAAAAGPLAAAPAHDSHASAATSPAASAAPLPASAATERRSSGAAADEGIERLNERLAGKLAARQQATAMAPAGVLRIVARDAAPARRTAGAAKPTAAATMPSRLLAAAMPHAPDGTAATGAERGAERPALPATAAAHPPHWDYQGEAGPQSWARLAPEFAKCSTGMRQSPIDIHDGIKVQLDAVQFDYRPSGFRVIDNGHTVQVNPATGNSIEVLGRRYELVQFHFHRPSEERIDGRQFDMVAHLVHKDVDGRLAVVAVLLDRGSAQPLVQTVWNNLPLEKGEEVAARTPLDPAALLPADRSYYTYMGSLTTPPCSEGVLWMVMKQPVTIAAEQIAIFARLYPMNARPIQQAAGRLIKESN